MKERVKTDSEGDESIDPILRDNFKVLMAGRAVGVLRAEMAAVGLAIGTSTIQRAMRGSDGLRVESLDKFAKFFGVQRHQLLMEGLGRQVGDSVAHGMDPDLLQRFSELPGKQQGIAEEKLRQAVEQAEAALGKPEDAQARNAQR